MSSSDLLMYKVVILSLILLGCTNLPFSEEIAAKTEVKTAEKVEIINNNKQVPEWALWAMGGGIFCFALIIPSPFRFRGFT